MAALAQKDGYVGSSACADCHVAETDDWSSSDHANAWRMPGPDMLRGAFQGEVFELDGMRAEFLMDGDTRLVRVTEKDGVTTEYPVHSVGGVAPLEQLILQTEPGRLQSFDVVWDVEKREWYHLYPDQDLPPDDGLHWTGPYKNWNARCAECHATNFSKNYELETDSYASTQSEIGVGCEACHGPGRTHLEQVNSGAPASDTYGFTVDFSDRSSGLEQCATCHSRREALNSKSPRPGTGFHDSYNLSLLRDGTYFPDGQIRDEVYVYGSFLQSKMYAKGVNCVDCHNPHSTKRIATDNALCAQCHSPAGNPDFPSLPLAEYDSPAHTRHPENTEGAQCVNCHMIERTYMGTDGRRDHSFRIPRPDLFRETGAPDACTTCHVDKSPEWAADTIAGWYPQGAWTQPHSGTIIAQGLHDSAAAAPDLISLARNADQNSLARATALWLMASAGEAVSVDDITPQLNDPDPLIRASAVQALRAVPPSLSAPYLVAALEDPTRNVRLAAARTILTIPANTAPAALRPAYRAASGTLSRVLGEQLDFPEAHIQIAGISLTQRNFPAAEAAFRTVVRLDPQQADAWVMLVRLAAARGGPTEARKVLAEALARVPDNPGLLDLARQL